ncbi:MAG: M24 family metallopeptidase [Vicinamibacterales bacterium]
MRADTAQLRARHLAVRRTLDRLRLDAFVTVHPANVFYLTNLAASAAALVMTPRELYLLSDFRYSAAVHRLLASSEAPPDTTFRLVEASYDEAVVDLVAACGPGRYGFESARVPVKQHAYWQRELAHRGPQVEWRATEDLVEQLRAIKDPFEVSLMTEAAARLSAVARDILASLPLAGRTELDVAADIDWRLKRAGFERTAFDTIVATGRHSAFPHAHPTEAVVSEGDLVLLDFGGVFHGYCVDLTRTTVVGTPTAEQQRIYRAVHDAQRAALACVQAGTSAWDVDAAARESLGRAGLADAFGHSTGHGLGLDIHEDPRLGRPRSGLEPPILAPGMVCTIEPGAYVPDIGGVRLEDDVLVTSGGAVRLTDVPYDDRLM